LKIEKAIKRDREIARRRGGHKVDNKGIFTLLEEQKKRAKNIKKERKEKEIRISGEN
jgi:hypothetical protein